MFTSKKTMAALALFTSEAAAIKYRPYAGSVPWGGDATKPEWEDPQDHKVNYFVPNFGKDFEIKASFKNMGKAEEDLGHILQASFDPPDEPKRNYFVPHFGEDNEIKYTKSNIAAAEKKFNHEYDTSAPPKDPPRNYFVPHFGEDTEIKYTKSNIAMAEKKFGHEYDTSAPADDPPRNYFVPHFGEDEDIKFTKNNIANAEKKVGTWNVQRDGNGAWVLPSVDANQYGNFKGENNWPSEKMPSLIQTDAEVNTLSDPICSSAGCTQYKHKKKELGYKINYSVPSFGRDNDINENFASLKTAEGIVGEKFMIGSTGDKYKNKAKDTDYNFNPALDGEVISTLKNLGDAEKSVGHKWNIMDVQLDSDIKADAGTESDPICSSAGCTQYKHKKKELGYKINYSVPSFGRDNDINENFASLKTAEGIVGEKFMIGSTGDKYKNKAKDTDYNFNPALDGEVISTLKNLGDAEKSVGHKWNIMDVQLDSDVKADTEVESDPICSSAGCTQYKHKKKELGYKINYPVPSFGRDNDINENFASLKTAEGIVGEKFMIGSTGDKYKNKAKDTDYNFNPALDGEVISTLKNLGDAEKSVGHKWNIMDVQLDSDVNADVEVESDPICSSAGCTQYKHKKKDLGYKINYGVPSFGRDHNINQNFESLDLAEKQLGHKWIWTKKEKDDPVEYYTSGPMDPEIVTSLSNLKSQEGIHGVWTLPKD